MVGGSDVGMHIDTPEQLQRLVHGGRILQQVADGRCRGQRRLAGVLVRHRFVAGHQVRDGEPLLIDAVQGEEQAAQGHILVDETFRQPAFAETVEFHVEGGDRLVSALGNRMQDHTGRGGEIEVPAHQDAVFRRAHRQRGAAILRRIGRNGRIVKTL